MDGGKFIEAVRKRLSERKGAAATYGAVAKHLGLTTTALANWRSSEITPRQMMNLLFRAEEKAIAEAERKAIRPIVEFFPIRKVKSRHEAKWEIFSTSDTNNAAKHPYRIGLKQQLDSKHGVYIFYDSRGCALYVGKARQQTLWREINGAFNRDRAVQRIRRVAHPERRVAFKTSEEKRRQIRPGAVKLHDVAVYLSAYCVSDRLIGELESLLMRSFPNDLLNSRMENLGWADES